MKPIHCDKCSGIVVLECECDCHPYGVKWREAKRLRLDAIAKADANE